MPPAISAAGVRKRYGHVEALAGVDLTVSAGEVVAVLGPNGAGKTTLVEILEGHRSRSAGDVSVLGLDPADARTGRELRRRIGIVLQSTGVPLLLSCAETLAWQGASYPDPRPAAELLELVDLSDQRDQRVGSLSGGQQRRLDLALGLIGRPALLFLDEPTTGFDPVARRVAWDLVARLRDEGTTVLLTTHAMDEAAALADRVVVVRDGRVVADGAPSAIAEGGAQTAVAFRLPAAVGLADLPARVRAAASADGSTVTVQTDDPVGVLHALTGWALAGDVALDGLEVTRPNLEDAYVELVGRAS